MRNVWLTAALLVLGVAFGLPGWIALHRDALEPHDGDLGLVLTRAPQLATGYPLYEAAAEAVEAPADRDAYQRLDRFRKEGVGDAAWIEDLFARNAAAYDSLRAALAAPLLQFPSDYDPDAIQARMDLHLDVQQLVRLAGAQSRVELERGDAETALELATLGLRVGRMLSAGENIDLLAMLMAASHTRIALADVERIVRATPLPRDSARALVDRLESARWRPGDWERVWAFEYQFVKASFRELGARGGDFTAVEDAGLPAWMAHVVPVEYLWQPNRTLTLLSDAYRGQVPKSSRFCADASLDLEPLEEPEPAPLRALLIPNAAGRMLVEIANPNFDRFQLRRCEVETQISLIQALVATRAYRDAEGRLPETLDALVPEYLPAVPLDRYDGAPLRYSRADARIWSVGERFASDSEPALSVAF